MGKKTEGSHWIDKRAWALAKQPGEHTDPALPGFGMRVSPKLKAVWTVKCSVGSGKDRQYHEATMGLVVSPKELPDGVNTLNLEQAKAKAKAWLDEKRMPAHERELRKQRGAKTLANMLEQYLDERVTKASNKLSEATKQYYRDVYARYLQECKDWPLVDLQYGHRQWEDVIRTACVRSAAWGNGAMALVSGIYDELYADSIVEVNPIRRVRKNVRKHIKIKQRDSHVHTLDLPKFVKQLFELRNQNSADALKLFLLTGMRNTAVLGMRRSQLDFAQRRVKVTTEDLGWKRWEGEHPLNRYAMEILRKRNLAVGDSEYFFPARHGAQKHMVDVRSSAAIASKDCETVATAHVLRRTFGTMANVIFPGDVALHAGLLTHRWALPDDAKTAITLKYTVTKERVEAASNRIASVILQIGGIEPITAETLQMLHAAAIDTSNLKLIEMEDEEGESANDYHADIAEELVA